MKKLITISFLPALIFLNFALTSCGIYSFTPKGTLPDSIKTVRVQIFENHAPYVNPQLTPNLTDRVRQKNHKTN